MRCPADQKPDDEAKGICRVVTPLGQATPGPGGAAPAWPTNSQNKNCTLEIQAALQDWRNSPLTHAHTLPPMMIGGEPSDSLAAPDGEPFGSSSIRVDWKGVSFDVRTYVYIVNNGTAPRPAFPWN